MLIAVETVKAHFLYFARNALKSRATPARATFCMTSRTHALLTPSAAARAYRGQSRLRSDITSRAAIAPCFPRRMSAKYALDPTCDRARRWGSPVLLTARLATRAQRASAADHGVCRASLLRGSCAHGQNQLPMRQAIDNRTVIVRCRECPTRRPCVICRSQRVWLVFSVRQRLPTARS